MKVALLVIMDMSTLLIWQLRNDTLLGCNDTLLGCMNPVNLTLSSSCALLSYGAASVP